MNSAERQIYQGLQEVFCRAEDSEKRAVEAERQVKELTEEIRRLKESEDAEMTRLKDDVEVCRDAVRLSRARNKELAEKNRLLKHSADAADYAEYQLTDKVQEQEKQIEELLQKVSEWEGKVVQLTEQFSEQEKELMRLTEEYEEMTDEYEELSENYSRLEDKLAEVSPKEAIAEHERQTQEQEQDPGTPPVREAAATVDSSTNTDNPLEPFRFGGCRCRVWKDGQGTQCSHAGRVNGVCGHHHSLIEEAGKGTWQFGFYDEPRPDIWGTDHGGKCLPIPTGRKEGNEILWSMPQKEWARAFSSQYQ